MSQLTGQELLSYLSGSLHDEYPTIQFQEINHEENFLLIRHPFNRDQFLYVGIDQQTVNIQNRRCDPTNDRGYSWIWQQSLSINGQDISPAINIIRPFLSATTILHLERQK